MRELIRYLLGMLVVDFEGDLTREVLMGFLREDESPDSRNMRAKLANSRASAQFLMTLADTLTGHLRTGITPTVIKDELAKFIVDDR